MQNIFPDGMFFRRPNEKAPDFVKGTINIEVAKFEKFAKKHQNADGWLSLDVKESKEGKIYLALNTFKAEKKVAEDKIAAEVHPIDMGNEFGPDDIRPEDIPF